MKNKWFSY